MKRLIFIFLFSYAISKEEPYKGTFTEDMKIEVKNDPEGCFCIDMSSLSSNSDFYAIFELKDGKIDPNLLYRSVESCDITCQTNGGERTIGSPKIEDKNYEFNINDENRKGKFVFIRYTGFNGTSLNFIMRSVSSNALLIGVGISVSIVFVIVIVIICYCCWKKVYKKKKEEMDENLQPSFVDTEKDKDKDDALLN